MLQLINKKKIYFYLISFLFLSTISNNHYVNGFKKNFLINKIDIQIDRTYLKKIISQNAKFLLNNNIFSINSEILKNKFNKLNYLENIEIKKKYPSTIIIKANKTEYLAETFIEEKKYFVGRNGKFISAEYHDHKNSLPMIFGTFKIKDFLKLQLDLNRNNINLKKIKKYYYHKNKRWDLYLDKEIILMLPSNNLSDAIKIFKKYNLNNEIKIKTTIDLRIPNRIIIRNG
jgi:cell division septal protein FtsQ